MNIQLTCLHFLCILGHQKSLQFFFNIHWAIKFTCILFAQQLVVKFKFPLRVWSSISPFNFLFGPQVNSFRIGFTLGRVPLLRSTNKNLWSTESTLPSTLSLFWSDWIFWSTRPSFDPTWLTQLRSNQLGRLALSLTRPSSFFFLLIPHIDFQVFNFINILDQLNEILIGRVISHQ